MSEPPAFIEPPKPKPIERRTMPLVVQTFVRKPFEVQAVRVDEQNMEEAAKWADGEILEDSEGNKYVKVKVLRPTHEKHTMAYPGYWIVFAPGYQGHRVYNNKAFNKSFDATYKTETVKHEDNRSAETGQFVSKEEADAHPDTTVHETS